MCVWFSHTNSIGAANKTIHPVEYITCVDACTPVFSWIFGEKQTREEAMAFTQSCWHIRTKMREEDT